MNATAAAVIAGLKKAAISLVGAVMTESMFMRVLSRLTVALLERIAKSTKTTVDDNAIVPIVIILKKHY